MRTGIIIVAVLLFSLVFRAGNADQAPTLSPQESATLYIGDKLLVSSSQPSIQYYVIRGNITYASVWNDTWPSRNISLTSNASETFVLNAWLSYPGPYTTSIALENSEDGSKVELPSYYVSNGNLSLTITAVFQPRPAAGTGPSLGWSSFYDWTGQFGAAFPLWIKILFLFLGVQFAFVGYRWIRFEDERRRLEGHLPPLDRGNKLYIWADIIFRSLLTAFALSLVVMVGEVLIILIAKYLFFVDLSLFSLVDFFSLFFIAALGSLVYLAREGLDRLLDLKPMVED